jgi:hypothetical protein
MNGVVPHEVQEQLSKMPYCIMEIQLLDTYFPGNNKNVIAVSNGYHRSVIGKRALGA